LVAYQLFSCVSIQLVSPASGECRGLKNAVNFTAVVSIQLVSPASGETLNKYLLSLYGSFHSISFPSEWGGSRDIVFQQQHEVSIQLVSPASGEASIIHPIQRKMSIGSLRGSGIIARNPTVTHP